MTGRIRSSFPRALGILCLVFGMDSPAQFQSQPSNLARSVSGQFTVLAARQESLGPFSIGRPEATTKLLRLEPSLVAVSCERIKKALGEELGPTGMWSGKVHISLQPARSDADQILVTSERFRDGWSYRLDVPNPVKPTHFVRAVVQVLLLEQANRMATTHGAEIPLWLSEGLLQQILATRSAQILLSPPTVQVNRLQIRPTDLVTRGADAATLARRALEARKPLTFEQLSWPKENQLDGPDAEVYQLSAQWFVAELCRLPEGRASLQAMLRESVNCLNWQTAFLRAYRLRFERLLDAEKWWTLTTVHVEGNEPGSSWTSAESWVRLDQILQVTAELRQAKSDLPQNAFIPLTTVIREWDWARQRPILHDRLTELVLARQLAAPVFWGLLDDYRAVLSSYLKQREKASINFSAARANAPTTRGVTRDTLRQLDRLELQRQKLKLSPAPAKTTSVAVDTRLPVRRDQQRP